jgi:hypothetical protein
MLDMPGLAFEEGFCSMELVGWLVSYFVSLLVSTSSLGVYVCERQRTTEILNKV